MGRGQDSQPAAIGWGGSPEAGRGHQTLPTAIGRRAGRRAGSQAGPRLQDLSKLVWCAVRGGCSNVESAFLLRN